MDDIDLQLKFAMCFDHFQCTEVSKDDQYKTPQGSKDSSPNENESESIEVVDNNTDICVLGSQYGNEDLREFFENEADEVFVGTSEILDKNEDFTMLHKPIKSRRMCNCEESTEVLMLINSEYQGKRKTTYSGTDSDVEVLMSEEVVESDWSSGHVERKSITCESVSDLKDALDFTPCSTHGISGTLNKEESTDLDVSVAELIDGCSNSFQNVSRAQLLQIIHQQDERIKALEATVERYHKAQQRLFEHVDALRLELNEIRLSPMPQSESK